VERRRSATSSHIRVALEFIDVDPEFKAFRYERSCSSVDLHVSPDTRRKKRWCMGTVTTSEINPGRPSGRDTYTLRKRCRCKREGLHRIFWAMGISDSQPSVRSPAGNYPNIRSKLNADCARSALRSITCSWLHRNLAGAVSKLRYITLSHSNHPMDVDRFYQPKVNSPQWGVLVTILLS